MKTNIAGKSVWLSIVSGAAIGMLWFWVAHGIERTSIVSSYLARNVATNSALELIGWASISPVTRDLVIDGLYWSLPVLFVAAGGITIYNAIQVESEDVV